MSAHGFIFTKGGIIIVETAVPSAEVMAVLSRVAREIADDGARIADAWQNSKSLNEFVGKAVHGDTLGTFKVVGAVAFGTAAAVAVPAIFGLSAATAGTVVVAGAAGWAAGKFYEMTFDGVADFSKNLSANEIRILPGSIEPRNILTPFPKDGCFVNLSAISAIKQQAQIASTIPSPIILDLNGNGTIDSGRELFGNEARFGKRLKSGAWLFRLEQFGQRQSGQRCASGRR